MSRDNSSSWPRRLIVGEQHIFEVLGAMQYMKYLHGGRFDAVEDEVVAVGTAPDTVVFMIRNQGRALGMEPRLRHRG